MKSAGITFFWNLPEFNLVPGFGRGEPPDGKSLSVTWLGIGFVVAYYWDDCVRGRPIPNWVKKIRARRLW
jgi:hypothetical protein